MNLAHDLHQFYEENEGPMDYRERQTAANARATDDGRDMWGLIDWKQEAYTQEDRAADLLKSLRALIRALGRIDHDSGLEICDQDTLAHAITVAARAGVTP